MGDGSVDARQRAGGRVRDIWCAVPKVVFSRTLDSVQGNARLAEASVAEEAAAALDATDTDVGIGGAGLVETRTFGSRVIYERYGAARGESD